jgi:hypothetical protein
MAGGELAIETVPEGVNTGKRALGKKASNCASKLASATDRFTAHLLNPVVPPMLVELVPPLGSSPAARSLREEFGTETSVPPLLLSRMIAAARRWTGLMGTRAAALCAHSA